MMYLFVLFITVIISGSGIFLFDKNRSKHIKFLLAFSGAFLIGISFMGFIPEVFEKSIPYVGVFIMLGFIIQLVLELISEGAEHGHTHQHHEGEKISPFLLLFGVCVHSFLEGMPILSQFGEDIKNSLVLGIVVHNIPISLTLMGLFIHYGLSKQKAFLYLTIFALTSPIGALFGKYVISNINTSLETLFTYTMAVVIGIFLHVSTSILFESSENHKYNIQKFLTILLGLIFAFGITLVE